MKEHKFLATPITPDAAKPQAPSSKVEDDKNLLNEVAKTDSAMKDAEKKNS
jgi:hypothetical protein